MRFPGFLSPKACLPSVRPEGLAVVLVQRRIPLFCATQVQEDVSLLPTKQRKAFSGAQMIGPRLR
jgi:hypothetical protein